jgi:hypothetical protein
MAKIMLGSLAGAISGALGNDVFSHNRHGYYVRRRVIPTKVTSDYTTLARNNLTACARAWGALTAAKQGAWNTWAQSHPITDRLGQKQVLFGAGAYTMLNARIMQTADAVITLPPTAAAPAPLLTLSMTATFAGQDLNLTYTATPLGATQRLWIQAAVMTNPGQNYFKNLLKLIYVTPLAEVSGDDYGTMLTDRFGAIAVGHRIICLAAVYESTSGLLSGPMLATCTVT